MPHLIFCINSDYDVHTFTDTVTIGRKKKNDIVLSDEYVSGFHAEIKKSDNGDYVLFNKGKNGTKINDKKIDTQVLSDNLTFCISNASFTFIYPSEEAAHRDFNELDQEEPITRMVLFETSESDIPQIFPEDSQHRFRHFLERISNVLSELDEKRLWEKMLREAMALSNAFRSVLFTKESGRKNPVIKHSEGFINKPRKDRKIKISRSTVKKVLEEGRSVLIHEKSSTDSVLKYDLKSVLCVPLKGRNEEVYGCIYLDMPKEAACFTEDDRHLLKDWAYLVSIAMENAIRYKKVVADKTDLKNRIKCPADFRFQSLPMAELYSKIKKVAENKISENLDFLIIGETGTGKELVAREIHNLSQSDGDFIPVNCGAITETTFESEFFGHTKGAFTGAAENKTGLFEAAENGTIFLDEIGEMSPELQVKLLRVLQEREVRPLGSQTIKKIKFRTVAATNKDLADETIRRNLRFRDDLYFRLKFSFIIPPLKARKDDLRILSEHFIDQYWDGLARPEISEEALNILNRHDWPGNVRELGKMIQEIALFSDLKNPNIIGPNDLPLEIAERGNVPADDDSLPIGEFLPLAKMEKQYVQEILDYTGNNKSKAARILKIGRERIGRIISREQVD